METKTQNRPDTKQTLAGKANDIMIEREFRLPVHKLWRAWSEPETYKKWWGPKEFTCPSSTIDFREGGTYLSCMLSSKGDEYWSTGTYKEIIPNKKIVMTDSFSDDKGNIVSAKEHNMPGDWPAQLLITVSFEESDGKTKMKLHHEGIPAEMRKDCITGWNESFDKLDQNIK